MNRSPHFFQDNSLLILSPMSTVTILTPYHKQVKWIHPTRQATFTTHHPSTHHRVGARQQARYTKGNAHASCRQVDGEQMEQFRTRQPT